MCKEVPQSKTNWNVKVDQATEVRRVCVWKWMCEYECFYNKYFLLVLTIFRPQDEDTAREEKKKENFLKLTIYAYKKLIHVHMIKQLYSWLN